MNNSESARKINQAVNNTISQARGVFSSFLSSFSGQAVNAATEPTDTIDTPIVLPANDKHIKIAEDSGNVANIVKLGIVEIGHDANVFESHSKNDIIDL